MENSSRTFFDAAAKYMRQARQAVGSATVGPKLLTYAEKLHYEGYLRWKYPGLAGHSSVAINIVALKSYRQWRLEPFWPTGRFRDPSLGPPREIWYSLSSRLRRGKLPV